jgi:glycosyltransferase involved in cell wall biosynthesis
MNKVRLYMRPNVASMGDEESGIKRVVEAYERYLPDYGYEFVDDRESADLSISHAGSMQGPEVVVCHGLYFTADYGVRAPKWESNVNHEIITAIRGARQVTVPSNWVKEVFQRDMRFSPTVVPHGIEWDLWQTPVEKPTMPYVLWNKNRSGVDVCSTDDMERLAALAPNMTFLSTFGNPHRPSNVHVIGLQPHDEMIKYVKGANIYLATVKETFGIDILEAITAGTPVLGWHGGGIEDLVVHGVNGYLAYRGDFDSLREGMEYCIKHHDTLGDNGREMAKAFTWRKGVEKLHNVLQSALYVEPPSVSVIIPCYNYADKVERAIISVKNQTYKTSEIIVVDDGSNASNAEITKDICMAYDATYIRKDNGGVATARNMGISSSSTKYVCCLDADDEIAPRFLEQCVDALESERLVALVYTGLTAVMPDGSSSLSAWPGEYNYDRFLKRQNQVPTCCVYKREVWERLGGYNQRYAPGGAGAEDAEFFLRAGAYGFGARKITNEGLFIYHAGEGLTSKPGYHEVDWLYMHPWTKDGKHPFASLASPENGFSHLVRQYDEPLVSVIIPVGPGHEDNVRDALDSLESQSFRKWEAIVVFDNWDGDVGRIGELESILAELEAAYPYIKLIVNKDKHRGAGWARNKGAAIARAPVLLFLDADDWLYPEAIDKMYQMWLTTGGVVYTDYVGKAFVSDDFARTAQKEGRLLHYNKETTEAVIAHRSAAYNCPKAQMQPDPQDMYIWNLITSMTSRQLHNQIGGFDEHMESWEDWDYWIRIARAGVCFYHLEEQLVVYRFYTGNRRETGLQQYPHLIQYLQDKYKRSEAMACTGCGKKNAANPNPSHIIEPVQQQVDQMSDNDFILISYNHPNLGQHRVVGASTKTNYGYRGGGGSERFYVHRSDIAANPKLFVPVAANPVIGLKVETPPAPAALVETIPNNPEPIPNNPEPKDVEAEKPYVRMGIKDTIDLQQIPGISGVITKELNLIGIHTAEELKMLSIEELMTVKGIGRNKALIIKEYLDEL